MVPVTSKALAKKYGNFPDGMVAKIFLGEASRTSEPEILDKVKEIAKVHNIIKDHISKLLWHHTFTNPTSAIREVLGVPQPITSSRVFYILVFRKLLPITKLHINELFDVWYQCILCHRTLWKEGVYHRDVSPGNLMWVIGGNKRTDVVPFMALDLLSAKAQLGEVKHLYCHDLESFMGVYIWICLRYRTGVLPAELRPLDEWMRLNPVTCGEKKYLFLGHLRVHYSSDIDSRIWVFLVECVEVLRDDVNHRSTRLDQLMARGAAEQSNNEQLEDIDSFLRMFPDLPNSLSSAALPSDFLLTQYSKPGCTDHAIGTARAR
ncbi:hypothetical protein DFJ58DRAFT_722527 [Suillus subalutaceus]|uniref:uncharacterized protein n=1 Tax=Suillus subalutaceus TaxID=48586 RepID=UPI001B87F41B|nr:uncharacterized protein DFJ58DRAFT_722527 [Suillus subalutaceus]KAG1871777.1 hypothetical protein DFJ58DRAFT_722527 [Suillus subalutaceus]